MAKDNNKNETTEQKLARLKAEMDALQEQAKKEETARLDALANKIRGFPNMLGVATMADVISLIKQVEKGTLGKLDATARTYKRLSDGEKATITERLKKGGAGNQVSELANEFGVSDGTIYGLKQDAGLTNRRGASAPAVPPVTAAPAAV